MKKEKLIEMFEREGYEECSEYEFHRLSTQEKEYCFTKQYALHFKKKYANFCHHCEKSLQGVEFRK